MTKTKKAITIQNEVQLTIDGKKGFFYIEVDGEQEAMMTFVFAGDAKIFID
jgi:hypothetical protein